MFRHPIQVDVVANVNGEVRHLLACDALSESAHTDIQAYPAPPGLPVPIPLNHGISYESGTLLPVAGVSVASSPLVYPSNTSLLKSTMRLFPSSGVSDGEFSNNTHSYARVYTDPATSHTPSPIETREEREPQNRPRRHQKSKKNGEVVSLHWFRRPADIRKAQFFCDCGAKYVQRQALNRHRREKHEPNLCLYCDFEWGRPYEYRVHLEKRHIGVDPDEVLGKDAGSRRRSAIWVQPRSQHVSLPTIEHGRWSHSGIRQYSHAVVKPSTATLPQPDMSDYMTYVSQPETTQPIMTSIPEGAVNWVALCS